MNLKQRTFFFVASSVTGLLLVYAVVSNYYVRDQEEQFFNGRRDMARTEAREFDEFFARGVSRLDMISQLPGLAYGLRTLETDREGKQIPAWTTLHYLAYQSDVFTDGIYLLNKQGQILWSEPPDVSILEAPYEPYAEILKALKVSGSDTALTTWRKPEKSNILIASRISDDDGANVGLLVGAIPTSHPVIHNILQRNSNGHGIAQLTDDEGRVIASTDPDRETRVLKYWRPVSHPGDAVARRDALDSGEGIVATASLLSSGWTVSIDQNAREALSEISTVKLLLAAFGVMITAIAICGLVFILRSFTKPIEMLTTAAKRIADGDLSGRFALDRTDEIGALAKTLDDMKTKLKSSYDLLLASEKMALMGQIVAGIAHELNNPLTIVLGNTQLLLMRQRDDADTKAITKVGESAQRASKIVKNLLTFARHEKPERKLTDINAIVTKTMDLHGYEMKVRNIRVELDLQQGLPETIADADQLQQVFLNLVVNAEQAMLDSNGKGVLRIKTREENRRILATFSDDGPGIRSENLERIFEPFFTTKAAGKGTGLGLSICQGIVGEHGGRIHVHSDIGHGTTFVVEIPIQQRMAVDPPPLPAPLESRPAKKHILVVEDELEIQQVLRDVLTFEGHRVDTAANGVAALQIIDQQNYDLILSDIKMPGMSGSELYAAIKRRGRSMEQRMVFITGDLMNSDTRHFIESTGCKWLGKPFDIEAVRKIVADVSVKAESSKNIA